jgi:hypothetical protein
LQNGRKMPTYSELNLAGRCPPLNAKFPVNTPYISYINSHIVLLNLNICCGNKCTFIYYLFIYLLIRRM